MTTPERLTIVVPCLNESANLRATVDDIHDIVPDMPFDIDIILIDDGSTDGTLDLMRLLADEHDDVSFHVNPRNLGPGRSVTQMYDRFPQDRWMCALPGDNEIVARSLVTYAELADQYDVILGYLKNTVIRTPLRRFASNAFTSVVQATYGFPYRYLNGPKLYRVGAFQGLDVVAGGHGFNPELLAKAILRNPHLRVGEAPFMARGRAVGSSTAFTPRNVARSLTEFYLGYRSVVTYRERIVRTPPGKPTS